jgi:nucleotide-binding universal stress UspA family protein
VDFTVSAGGFDVPREELIESAREQLQKFAETNIPPAVPYDVRVMVGPPIDSILEQASESGADLIVMGTHGRTGIKRLLVGSVTEAVVRLAPVPVLAIHELAKKTSIARWIVGSVMPVRESRAALCYSAILAEPSSHFVLFGSGEAQRPFTIDDLKLLEVCTPREIIGRATFRALEAVEPQKVLDTATEEGADLIVLGIPGDRTFAETLLGTMAERVVQHSTCPVLTMNHYAAARMTGADVDEREPALTA